MGNGMHEKLIIISGYVCNRLFSIGEDSFITRRMASVCKLFGRYKQLEREFFSEHRLSMYQERITRRRIA